MILPVNPKQVLMRFLARCCGCTPDQDPQDIFEYPVTSTPSLSGVTFGQEEFSSTCVALFAPGITTSANNQSQLQALSDKFTTDYLNWRQYSIDETLNGICAVVPNGILGALEFTYSNKKCSTRLYSLPVFYSFQQLGHQSATQDTDCPDTDLAHTSSISPCVEIFGPPVPTETGGSTTFAVYKLCKQDGRYLRTYEKTVTYPCRCSGCTVTICVYCITSGTVIVGAIVTIDGGTPQTTGVSGCVSFPGISSGAHHVSITNTGAGHGTVNGSYNLGCGNNNFNVCCTTKICVVGCGGAAITSGFVEMIDGSNNIVQSGNLDGTGCVTLFPSPSGSYAIRISSVPCYPTYQTVPISCGGNFTFDISNLPGTFTPAIPCCGTEPLPNTLFFTDGCGTKSVSFSNGPFFATGVTWCTPVASNPVFVPTPPPGQANCQPGGAGTALVQTNILCNGDGTYTAIRSWGSLCTKVNNADPCTYVYDPGISCPGTNACAGTANNETSQSAPTSPTSTCPFVISFTLTPDPGNHLADPCGAALAVSA